MAKSLQNETPEGGRAFGRWLRVVRTGWRRRCVAVGLLLAGGWALSYVSAPATRWREARQPALQAKSLEGALGHGVLLGMFGGFRNIMADFSWVRSYVHWVRRDRASCETYMRLSLALAPDNSYFHTGFADIVAYDMPHWEIREREQASGRRVALPKEVELEIRHRYAERGLAILAKGMTGFPEKEATFWWKSAIVCASRLQDWERCATFYKRAAECTSPMLAAELSYVVIMTEKLNRRAEAAEWLHQRAEQARKRGDVRIANAYEEWSTSVKSAAANPEKR